MDRLAEALIPPGLLILFNLMDNASYMYSYLCANVLESYHSKIAGLKTICIFRLTDIAHYKGKLIQTHHRSKRLFSVIIIPLLLLV